MSKKNKKANRHQKQDQREQSRVGKRADDIFSLGKPVKEEKPVLEHPSPALQKTEIPQIEAIQTKQMRGRPVEHKEEWSKITVVLLDKQIHWLDQLASTIRLKTKAAISRAELIRATIAAIEESGIDLSDIKTEAEAKQKIFNSIKK
jgi:hypothetical protein